MPQPEQHGAALLLRVELVAQPAQRGLEQQPAEPSSAARTVAAPRTAPSSAADDALHHLQRHVAGEAVGDDHVRLAGADREPLDVADEVQARRSRRARNGPRRRSPCPWSPPSRWPAAPRAGDATPATASMNAAPMCANWTSISGRTSTFAPASSSRNGLPGTGIMIASAGRWTPRTRLKPNSDAASAAPVEPPQTSASASPAGDGRDGADDRRLRRAAHGAGGIGVLGDRHRSVDHRDMRRHRRRSRRPGRTGSRARPRRARHRARPQRGRDRPR